MPFDQNSLLWVKLEGYPWWPAIVTESSDPLPEGADTAVLFLHTNDMSFVNSADTENVVQYGLDAEADQAKRVTEDPDCLAAIAVMDSILVGPAEEQQPHEEDADEDGEDEAAQQDSGESEETRQLRKEAKKQRKAEKKAAKEAKRLREAEEAAAARQAAKSKKRARRDDLMDGTADPPDTRAMKTLRGQRQAAQELRQTTLESNENYRRFDLAPSKRPATSQELLDIATKIKDAQTIRNEESILECLSQLTKFTVTLKQLQKTKIGVLVGSLLDGTYPYCRLLAQAILQFWFQQLPTEFRKNLQQSDELERASVASNEDAGDQRPEMSMLNAFGVQVESCFQVEEVDETPGLTDASHVAAEMDAWLNSKYPSTSSSEPNNETDDTNKSFLRLALLAFLKDMDHGAIRRQLLAKELTVDAFLTKFVQDTQFPHSGDAAATRPLNLEEEYENVTHLLTCPSCGAHDASVAEIVKGGYGEEGETVQLATCIVCKHAWQEV